MTTTQPNPPPAEAFPVGEYLLDELEARGWSIAEFAEILGRPAQAVSEIINGHKEITRETASEIAAATRTSAETWLRLQDAHLLWSAAAKPQTKLSAVRQRAQLASLVPLRELTRRGFLPKGDVAAQERALRSLFGVESLDQPPRWSLAARRTGTVGELSAAQTAWVGVVRWMAARTPSRPYDRGSLVELGQGLARSLKKPADLTGLVERLSSVGVRLVHVAKFDGGKIDGVAFTDDRGPVIGISGRIGRFDSVVFTLLHEIAHVVLGHVDASITLDVDLGANDESGTEQEANTRGDLDVSSGRRPGCALVPCARRGLGPAGRCASVPGRGPAAVRGSPPVVPPERTGPRCEVATRGVVGRPDPAGARDPLRRLNGHPRGVHSLRGVAGARDELTSVKWPHSDGLKQPATACPRVRTDGTHHATRGRQGSAAATLCQ